MGRYRVRGSTGISYKDNPREYARRYWLLVKGEAIDKLGGACAVCGERDKVVLQIDHVDGNGHLQKAPGGRRYWYGALKEILDGQVDGYQVLCANCHVRKTIEHGDHLASSSLQD